MTERNTGSTQDISRVMEAIDGVSVWDGPFDAALRARAADALENGKVVFLPDLAFALAPAETRFLSPDVADGSSKNVSYNPAAAQLKGTAAQGAERAGLEAMMRRFSDQAERLLTGLIPHYAAAAARGRTSYRPVEVKGRPSSYRKDDTRLHVDAFPSTPTAGRRILRVFSNVNPHGQGRHWRLGAPFGEVARHFLPRLPRQWPGSAWLLKTLRATKSPRTGYDHLMLHLHDGMKADLDYQRTAPQSEFFFPPGSTWIVYTDQAAHAAMGGQYLFEQTFYLPVAGMLHPERSPLKVLEGLTGRALV